MLLELMHKIQKLEENHPEVSQDSSFGRPPSTAQLRSPVAPEPIPPLVKTRSDIERRDKGNKILQVTQGLYLPCHYFDYISGTSTGG